jgi:hypothetical protein
VNIRFFPIAVCCRLNSIVDYGGETVLDDGITVFLLGGHLNNKFCLGNTPVIPEIRTPTSKPLRLPFVAV